MINEIKRGRGHEIGRVELGYAWKSWREERERELYNDILIKKRIVDANKINTQNIKMCVTCTRSSQREACSSMPSHKKKKDDIKLKNLFTA